MSLIDELKRRKVFKVGAAYLVVAWLVVQAASIGFPAFDAPPWALRAFILVAFLGFPVALVMAWVFDSGPDGLKLDPAGTGTIRVFALATLLAVLALGWYFFGQPAFRKGEKPGSEYGFGLSPVPSAAAPAKPYSDPGFAPAAPRKSIAVLAFSDLSPTHDQEYFSDGVAEEVLNALAKVKDLKVAGRTASFYYKGRNEPMRAIGETLGVAHILEGSVRKQGDKVRVTAQLIQASDGFHLWSETYDGDLSDVFALQERIARAITDQLKVVLEGGQVQRLVEAGTTNPEAYALYLQASATFNRREGAHFPDAAAQLEQALKLDPAFARAYARAASLYVVMPVYTEFDARKARELVEKNAQDASRIDPKLAEPYAAVGLSSSQLPGGVLIARDAFERALALDPDDVTTNFWCGLGLMKSGYTKRGAELIDRALALDPLLPNALRWRAILHLYAGERERGEQLLRRAREVGLRTADRELADLAAERGDLEQARRLWTSGADVQFRGAASIDREEVAAGIFGDASARAKAAAILDAFVSTHSELPGQLSVAMVRVGRPAQVMTLMGSGRFSDSSDYFALLWSPLGREQRALPEFPKFLRDFGFIALWDKYGPPDTCKHRAPGDYVCE